MKITFITLFPDMFQGPFAHSILKRAVENTIIDISFVNIREYGIGKHKQVDDTPYGGGAGMLLRVDVLEKAIDAAKCKTTCNERIILLDAGGTPFSQKKAQTLTTYDHLIFVCAHYEGVDERTRGYIDEELSIGDYVLTGGELPAMVITDAVARLIPGVLGKEISAQDESFQHITGEDSPLLEYPHYTKPIEYKGKKVPEILLSGHHKHISVWRKQQAKEKTSKVRPDLLKK